MSFLKLENDLRNSMAARTLSPGAFRVLTDVVEGWNRHTAGGRVPVGALRLSWASDCNWTVQETAWRGYRDELVNAGFLVVVNAKAALYRLSEGWREREVGPTKLAKFQRVEAARARRSAKKPEHLRVVRGGIKCDAETAAPTPEVVQRNGSFLCSEIRCTDADLCSENRRTILDPLDKDPRRAGTGVRIKRKDGTVATFHDQESAMEAWRRAHGIPYDLTTGEYRADYDPELLRRFKAFEAKIAHLPESAPTPSPTAPVGLSPETVATALELADPESRAIVAKAWKRGGFCDSWAREAVAALRAERLRYPMAPATLAARFVHRASTPPSAWFAPRVTGGGAVRGPGWSPALLNRADR